MTGSLMTPLHRYSRAPSNHARVFRKCTSIVIIIIIIKMSVRWTVLEQRPLWPVQSLSGKWRNSLEVKCDFEPCDHVFSVLPQAFISLYTLPFPPPPSSSSSPLPSSYANLLHLKMQPCTSHHTHRTSGLYLNTHTHAEQHTHIFIWCITLEIRLPCSHKSSWWTPSKLVLDAYENTSSTWRAGAAWFQRALNNHFFFL